MKRGRRKKSLKRSGIGQVWLETVIYTLIALVMIGLVLGYAKPKIEQLQDKTLIEQSTSLVKEIDSTILTIGSAGNQRIIELTIKEGSLIIDGLNDKIVFEMESDLVYSEPGKNITDGDVIILTEEKTDNYLVTITRDYKDDYDLKINGQDVSKTISKGSNSYKLTIANEGKGEDDRTILNMSIS